MSTLKDRANARNQLFRQIYGFSLTTFIESAIRANAITVKELDVLNQISMKFDYLKRHQFEGSKEVGLKPKRRCKYCKNIARFEADTYTGVRVRLCNRHKSELESKFSDHLQCYAISNIKEINPNE